MTIVFNLTVYLYTKNFRRPIGIDNAPPARGTRAAVRQRQRAERLAHQEVRRGNQQLSDSSSDGKTSKYLKA